MSKRSIVRIAAILVAFVAGLAVSARSALAVNVPDPIGPVQGGASGAHPLSPVAAPASSVVILGMDWELALAVGIFAVAAALFLTTAVQRRHIAHT